jgi:hypothetical protein
MKSNLRKISFFHALLSLLLIGAARPARGQCTAAPIAAAACSGGSGNASSGITISSPNVFWVTATTTFANITLSGGTLRICGNLTITNLNFNSGNLIVESGGMVTINNMSSNLNGNCVFINRGTTTVKVGFTFQNSGNAIYNDLSTSVFNATNTVKLLNAQIVNRGNMSFSELDDQGSAGNFCVQDQTISTFTKLDNETTNSFAYSGLGSPACVNITNSVTLNSNLTNSPKIHVCKGGSVSTNGGATGNPGGGYGSAVVTSNCSSCATVLALGITAFTATKQGQSVDLRWMSSQDPEGNEVFYVEKSPNGADFYTLALMSAVTGQNVYSASDPSPGPNNQYYRLKIVLPSGALSYSAIVVVRTASTGFHIYPNPVRPNTGINLVIPSHANETARISLVDMAGQVVLTRTIRLVNGNNMISWDLPTLSAGTYMVRVGSPTNGEEHERITVLAN